MNSGDPFRASFWKMEATGSHGPALGNLFITQSTAEGELLSYNEAFIEAESIASLLEMLGVDNDQMPLWRQSSRHHTLQVRDGCLAHLAIYAFGRRSSGKCCKVTQSCGEAHHLKGDRLVADGLTKSLLGQAFTKFRLLLGMKKAQIGEEDPSIRSLRKEDPGDQESRWWSMLLSVVGPLMKVGHCVVASLILALVMLKQGGRTKDRKKIEKTAQEPEKVGGPIKPRENDRSGTVPPVVSSIGLTGTAIRGGSMNQLKGSVVSEDVAPSLRALRFDERKEGRDSSGSHGSSSHQSGAKARGAAAINTTSSLQPSGREKTSVTVDVEALAGSLEVNLRVASTAAGSSDRQSVRVASTAAGSSDGQSVRVASAAAGYGGGQSMRVETDGLQSGRGYGQPRAVPSSKDKMIFEQFEEVKPWDLSVYKSIRHASTDTWDLDHWKEGLGMPKASQGEKTTISSGA